jgi:predicted ATPase
MNIERIHLENFKCFKDISIDCSKFTLLTGANSSGKSSILYGLLGAIQTKNFPLYYSPNGNYVSMGDFGELAYEHSSKSNFSIGLTLKNDKIISTFDSSYSENDRTKLPRLQSFKFKSPTFTLDISKESKFQAAYELTPENDDSFQFKTSEVMRNAMAGLLNAVDKSVMKEKAKKGVKPKRGWSVERTLERMFKYEKSGAFAFDDVTHLEKNLSENSILRGEFNVVTSMLSEFDRKFNYLSSFRLPPDRTYYQKAKSDLKVDKYGDNSVDQILEWEHGKSKKLKDLKLALRKLELLENIQSEKYGGGRFEMRVVPQKSKYSSSLCDVGFGVSQFLPILVADYQLGKESTLAVSQPEIHLHPSVQANIADYMADNAQTHSKRYVLETHSEYLINRFRLLIAKGKLKEEDVSVYFLAIRNGKSVCYPIHFLKNGKIKGAPKDFFKTYMMDVMDIAMAS